MIAGRAQLSHEIENQRPESGANGTGARVAAFAQELHIAGSQLK
jgi:hypothetical protein